MWKSHILFTYSNQLPTTKEVQSDCMMSCLFDLGSDPPPLAWRHAGVHCVPTKQGLVMYELP